MRTARIEQHARVGVSDIAVAEVVDSERFDNPALLHHGHAVAKVCDHAEIVGYEDVGEPVAVVQRSVVEDLGLHRHVECRGRLVQQQDARFEDQRARDRARWRCPPESWCG